MKPQTNPQTTDKNQVFQKHMKICNLSRAITLDTIQIAKLEIVIIELYSIIISSSRKIRALKKLSRQR